MKKDSFTASWVTFIIHSSSEAIDVTDSFLDSLFENSISCNIVAAYYHDHIFVDKKDTDKSKEILNAFSN